MPKKSAKKAKPDLTKEQIQELGNILQNVGGNIYVICRSRYGVDITDETWDRLKAEASTFKCEECDRWLHTEEESDGITNFCQECVDEMDATPYDPDGEGEDEED